MDSKSIRFFFLVTLAWCNACGLYMSRHFNVRVSHCSSTFDTVKRLVYEAIHGTDAATHDNYLHHAVRVTI